MAGSGPLCLRACHRGMGECPLPVVASSASVKSWRCPSLPHGKSRWFSMAWMRGFSRRGFPLLCPLSQGPDQLFRGQQSYMGLVEMPGTVLPRACPVSLVRPGTSPQGFFGFLITAEGVLTSQGNPVLTNDPGDHSWRVVQVFPSSSAGGRHADPCGWRPRAVIESSLSMALAQGISEPPHHPFCLPGRVTGSPSDQGNRRPR